MRARGHRRLIARTVTVLGALTGAALVSLTTLAGLIYLVFGLGLPG